MTQRKPATGSGHFRALLRHFRRDRGLSQLDLSSMADVSARHLSFLETGRAEPSREMVMRLAAALGLTLRDSNGLLEAAGFAAAYRETELRQLQGPIRQALELMLSHHEPYPMVVFDGVYDILLMNHSATTLLGGFLPGFGTDKGAKPNLLKLTFDPEGLRPLIVDFERVGRALITRLQRDILRHGRPELQHLLSLLLAYPDIPDSWRTPDYGHPSEPTLPVRMAVGDLCLSFFSTVTVFNAPQDITLEELHIESFFPLDSQTAEACKQLTAG